MKRAQCFLVRVLECQPARMGCEYSECDVISRLRPQVSVGFEAEPGETVKAGLGL